MSIKSPLFGAVAALTMLAAPVVMAQTSTANPPGTAASRALDRAAGTDTSGAYPSQRDGTPGNPPGTAAGRALDRAAGTNNSGAYPQQADGTASNPRGTAVSRTAHRAKKRVQQATH